MIYFTIHFFTFILLMIIIALAQDAGSQEIDTFPIAHLIYFTIICYGNNPLTLLVAFNLDAFICIYKYVIQF